MCITVEEERLYRGMGSEGGKEEEGSWSEDSYSSTSYVDSSRLRMTEMEYCIQIEEGGWWRNRWKGLEKREGEGLREGLQCSQDSCETSVSRLWDEKWEGGGRGMGEGKGKGVRHLVANSYHSSISPSSSSLFYSLHTLRRNGVELDCGIWRMKRGEGGTGKKRGETYVEILRLCSNSACLCWSDRFRAVKRIRQPIMKRGIPNTAPEWRDWRENEEKRNWPSRGT